jgi:uncharacterized protein with HEPN domain
VQLRTRIVDGYWSVDFSIPRTTATDRLPGLVTARRAVLDVLDPPGGP